MAAFNRVMLMGNLTRDFEVKHTQSGTAVAEVSVAVNDKRKAASGETIEEVTFVDVTFWGKTAETVAKYLGKGSPIFVEGRLKQDTWEKDGQKRSKLRVVCERMQFVGGGGKSDQNSGASNSEYSQPHYEPSTPAQDDDIPF